MPQPNKAIRPSFVWGITHALKLIRSGARGEQATEKRQDGQTSEPNEYWTVRKAVDDEAGYMRRQHAPESRDCPGGSNHRCDARSWKEIAREREDVRSPGAVGEHDGTDQNKRKSRMVTETYSGSGDHDGGTKTHDSESSSRWLIAFSYQFARRCSACKVPQTCSDKGNPRQASNRSK